jgi:hypothetical protein
VESLIVGEILVRSSALCHRLRRSEVNFWSRRQLERLALEPFRPLDRIHNGKIFLAGALELRAELGGRGEVGARGGRVDQTLRISVTQLLWSDFVENLVRRFLINIRYHGRARRRVPRDFW